jgi:hypothetical protein
MMSLALSYDAVCDFFKQLGAYEQPSANAKREWGTELVTNTGIYLERPPLRNHGYDVTPTNSVMFARTGGDGVHFSFVTKGGVWSEASPIVMTCPGAGSARHNVIVGADLVEFLRLGIRTGYFSLAQLSQGPSVSENSFVREDLSSGRVAPWLEPQAVAELEALARRFELTPWSNVGARLEELQRSLLPALELPHAVDAEHRVPQTTGAPKKPWWRFW